MVAERASHNDTSVPLLATRFFVPPPPVACVSRTRLFELLERGLHLPVTLVCAPPGFGKSSLLSQWIHTRANLRVGWLSLEPSDQDWGLFFRYLVAAWQRVFPQAGKAALTELQASPSPNREVLANLLLNDLLSCQEAASQEAGEVGQALLVLDDYHRIDSTAIHETVAYIVEHLPPGCHLVLLARADPPLPAARWRSRGLLLEVRADDLRFTTVEASEYLNQNLHLALTGEQIGVLEDRTEGWIAGLQMAALTLRGREDAGEFVRDFGGSNRFVVDYLVEEVVRQQPEEIQEFLLQTAVLERFCAELCENVIRDSSICDLGKNQVPALRITNQRITDHESQMTLSYQSVLERLEKANLFLIALDDRRCWFRYHHLFAELLRIRLQQKHAEQIPVLYRRAAEWFARNGLWRDAMRYALQTKDMEFSTALFEEAILNGGLDFLFSGIRPLIEPFPSAMVKTRPILSLAKAVAILEMSQVEGVESLLRFAEKGTLTSPPFPGQDNLLGWIYLIQGSAAMLSGDLPWLIEASRQVPLWIPNDRIANVEALIQVGNAYYYQGNLNQADACWQQVLDMSLAANDTYYTLSLLNGLGRVCFIKGENHRSEMLLQRGLHLLAEHPGQYLIWLGAMQRDYSDILKERNRLNEAHALMVAALPLCEKYHTVSAYGCALIYMGRTLLALGDYTGAHEMLDKADELRRTHAIFPDLETLAQVTHARIYLEEGKAEQAWQILETCLQSACSKHEFHREWVLTAQARVLVNTGRAADGLSLLSGRLESAKENGRGRSWLTMCLITALAHQASGDRQTAIQTLGEALIFAQAQDFRRIIVEEGEPARALLEEFRVQFPQSSLADYVAEIIALFPPLPAAERFGPLKIESLYESLSGREVEILRLVCQGLSNQEIAGQLVLSVGTVKFHIHNIFGKLGVRDRPQAIAKAGLLDLGK